MLNLGLYDPNNGRTIPLIHRHIIGNRCSITTRVFNPECDRISIIFRVSIFENSKSRYYDVEYHKLIVIRDIFENLDVFKMKYLNNKELENKLDYVGEILKLFKNKLKDMKEKEDKCNILREISYDLT